MDGGSNLDNGSGIYGPTPLMTWTRGWSPGPTPPETSSGSRTAMATASSPWKTWRSTRKISRAGGCQANTIPEGRNATREASARLRPELARSCHRGRGRRTDPLPRPFIHHMSNGFQNPSWPGFGHKPRAKGFAKRYRHHNSGPARRLAEMVRPDSGGVCAWKRRPASRYSEATFALRLQWAWVTRKRIAAGPPRAKEMVARRGIG